MNTSHRPGIYFLGLSLYVAASFSLPLIASTGIHTPYIFASSPWIASMVEKLLSFLFLGTGILVFLKYKTLRSIYFQPRNHAAILPGLWFPAGILLIALPMITWVLFFTQNAFASLYPGDFDFTGMSSAIQSTALGKGFFITPYYETGFSKSYLSHHFSPSLIFFVPIYWIFGLIETMGFSEIVFSHLPSLQTHFLYGLALWMTLPVVFFSWASFFKTRSRNDFIAFFSMALLLISLPLWRITQSFHFEILALAFSGFAFTKENERNSTFFWISLFLWMGVKEDIPIYTFFYGLGTLVDGSINRSRSLKIMMASALFFVFATLTRNALSGGEGPIWMSWIYTSWEKPAGAMKPPVILLASLAFLPVWSFRFFLFAIVPIFFMHYLSGHPWHSIYYGHYSYGIAPLLFRSMLFGFKHWTNYTGTQPVHLTAAGMILLSVSLVVSAGEKESPAPFRDSSHRLREIRSIMKNIPRGSCVRTTFHLSPHVPLNATVFPILGPEKNILNQGVPFAGGTGNHFNNTASTKICDEVHVILDPNRPMEPYYGRSYLHRYVQRLEESATRVPTDGPIRHYKFALERKRIRWKRNE